MSDDELWNACHDTSPHFSDDDDGPRYRSDLQLPFLEKPLRLEHDRELNIAGRTWNGALALLSFLASQPDVIRGKRVIELGAGTGVVSIGCDLLLSSGNSESAAHTHSIIVTDLAEAVTLMAQNISLNGARHTLAAELCWGETDFKGSPFDVVLMAEVCKHSVFS